MTSVTTAGGLLSFLVAGLVPIIHLGIFAPFGIILALIFCLIMLPALLSLIPLKPKPQRAQSDRATPLERAIVAGGDWSVTHPKTIILVTIVLIVFSISGMQYLKFSNDVIGWLRPDDPVRAATDVIDRELGGSITLEMVVDTGRVDGVKQAAFLNGLDSLDERIHKANSNENIFIGKTISIADILKEIHRALNENREEFYTIPQDNRLVAQELLLFENTGTDDLENVVDARFQLSRFTLKVPYNDPIQYPRFIEEVEGAFLETFGDEIEITTTGFMALMGETISNVITGMVRSYSLAIAIITPLMILLIGNLRGGLVSMVPNLTPIFLTLGLMGWFGLTIDMFTMMIGSIAIGLAVDDTIHFIHGFRRDFERLGDARLAVRETLQTTGRALLVTSVVLSSGFLVFALSEMRNLVSVWSPDEFHDHERVRHRHFDHTCADRPRHAEAVRFRRCRLRRDRVTFYRDEWRLEGWDSYRFRNAAVASEDNDFAGSGPMLSALAAPDAPAARRTNAQTCSSRAYFRDAYWLSSPLTGNNAAGARFCQCPMRANPPHQEPRRRATPIFLRRSSSTQSSDDPEIIRDLIERHSPYLPVQRYFTNDAEYRASSGRRAEDDRRAEFSRRLGVRRSARRGC